MLTVESPNQTSSHHVIKPHNGRCYLMTNNIQTNTGCAKCMQLRFTIDYGWVFQLTVYKMQTHSISLLYCFVLNKIFQTCIENAQYHTEYCTKRLH